jgi:hypothetical protein
MTVGQCMGGWCRERDKCAFYVAPPLPGRMPAERLCGAVDEPEPIKSARDQVQPITGEETC